MTCMTERRIFLALVLAAALPRQEQPFNQRPADAKVVMSTSRGKYDGEYTFSQIAQVCGEVPADMNFAGVPTFIVQFPAEGDGPIVDVTFASAKLVGGVKSTTSFELSVTVKSPAIGAPNAYRLDTARPKMSGTATLSSPSAGQTQLKVVGVNDLGESVDLTMTCKAKKT